MKYVLDSSIGFKWVVTEDLSDEANALRDDFRNRVHELIAPDVFPIEIMHALIKAERQGRVTPAQGGKLWIDMMTTAPQFFASLPLLPRAYEIASAARDWRVRLPLRRARGMGNSASL
ncbi:MAG: type II toxin-antitoxin system VapC family toxin [Planctomycetes bacterium]|nr:type II toxin-antitoxin system VapC family toxin [Planctomycetota bacterium]